MQRQRAIQVGLIGSAAAAAVVPIPPAVVERWFSTGIYPHLQQAITPVTNLAPFAWFDVILLAITGGTVVVIVRCWRQARRERRWRPIGNGLWTLTVAGAAVYLLFLAAWGLNYRRLPMGQRVAMKPVGPTNEEVKELGLSAVAQMNALHAGAHASGWSRDEWRDRHLVEAFHTAQRFLQDTPPIVPGRLKATLLAPYFRWAGVDGMVDPFALEALVNRDLLPWERPFVAAHEWAHLAGFADESEASFVAWLATLYGETPAQYSGWLYVYWQVSAELQRRDRDALAATLDPGPRRDVAAIVERLRRGQLPLLRTASWAVYDQYLRANRVEEGVRSYGEVITLILQTRFESGHRPVRVARQELSR